MRGKNGGKIGGTFRGGIYGEERNEGGIFGYIPTCTDVQMINVSLLFTP